jgi:hypothetical protein
VRLHKAVAVLVLLAGIAFSVLAVVWAQADQCPDDFTQAQIDGSDCIVGANIGLGLVVLFVLPLVISGALLAAVRLWRRQSATDR